MPVREMGEYLIGIRCAPLRTGLRIKVLRVEGRQTIQIGAFGDPVIFDLNHVRNLATYTSSPTNYRRGWFTFCSMPKLRFEIVLPRKQRLGG